jgi:hypothetical protein
MSLKYEIRPRKGPAQRQSNSEKLPYGVLGYGEPNAIEHALAGASFGPRPPVAASHRLPGGS